MLIKRWDDWSDGIGFVKQTDEFNGMYYSNGLLGLTGELRVAPYFIPCTLDSAINLNLVCSAYNLTGAGASTIRHDSVSFEPAASSTIAVLQTDADNGSANSATNTTVFGSPAAGSNRCMVVVVANNGNANATGVTFGGNVLTNIANFGSTAQRCSFWRLMEATVAGASGNVVASFAGAVDSIVTIYLLSNTHQTTPVEASTYTGTELSNFYSVIEQQVIANGIMIDSICNTTTEATAYTSPVTEQTIITSTTSDTLRAASGYRLTNAYTDTHFQYFFEEKSTLDKRYSFLYAIRGNPYGGSVTLYKIGLNNFASDYGIILNGTTVFGTSPGLVFPGQPAKYQTYWTFPTGNDMKPRRLTAIGTGDHTTDTIDAASTPFEPGADHHAILRAQLLGVVQEGVSSKPGVGGIGTQAGGVRILTDDTSPLTAANWGSEFQVGDKNERVSGVFTLENNVFVVGQDGLLSFGLQGKSGLVFEDFRRWRNLFHNILGSTWKGGILIPHPTGLIFYTPGELPINIDFQVRSTSNVFPLDTPTQFIGGRFLCAKGFGDYVYAIYQPEITSYTAMMLTGYAKGGDPTNLAWQNLGNITLSHKNLQAGCHITTRVEPSEVSLQPNLWFGNLNNIDHIRLDQRGGPFRSRNDIHLVQQSAQAYMSEIFLPINMELTRLVVYTQDMRRASLDEWNFSLIINGVESDVRFGHKVIENGRTEISLLNNRASCKRLILHVSYTCSDVVNSRVPPTIKKIEIYGRPVRNG